MSSSIVIAFSDRVTFLVKNLSLFLMTFVSPVIVVLLLLLFITTDRNWSKFNVQSRSSKLLCGFGVGFACVIIVCRSMAGGEIRILFDVGTGSGVVTDRGLVCSGCSLTASAVLLPTLFAVILASLVVVELMACTLGASGTIGRSGSSMVPRWLQVPLSPDGQSLPLACTYLQVLFASFLLCLCLMYIPGSGLTITVFLVFSTISALTDTLTGALLRVDLGEVLF